MSCVESQCLHVPQAYHHDRGCLSMERLKDMFACGSYTLELPAINIVPVGALHPPFVPQRLNAYLFCL